MKTALRIREAFSHLLSEASSTTSDLSSQFPVIPARAGVQRLCHCVNNFHQPPRSIDLLVNDFPTAGQITQKVGKRIQAFARQTQLQLGTGGIEVLRDLLGGKFA